MRKVKLLTILLCLSIISAGCCTMFLGKTEKIKFNTEPEGAEVYLNNSKIGTTPMAYEVPRKRNARIEFRKEGYEDFATYLKREVSPLSYAIYLFGIPALIDYKTGSIWDFSPNELNIILSQIEEEAR